MLDFLIRNPWLVALIWAVMYIFDYRSTVWLAGAYQATLSRYVVYEHGVELNPNFEKEIAAAALQRPRGPGLSRKFMILSALVVVIILLSPVIGPLFTEFLTGALLLTWSFINARHLRNYAYIGSLRSRPDALGGKQQYSYWLMQKMLSSEALTFSLLFLFLGILTWRLFFLGGAVTCLGVGIRALRLANRKFPASAMGKVVP